MLEIGFPVHVVRGVPVVAVPEEIDVTSATTLQSALEAVADGCPALVVDMTRTRFCDSAVLNVLVRVHKRARSEGGELLLAVPGTALRRVLAISGIDQVIPNFASLDEALAGAIELADGRTPLP
jgi:anti-sigma B factor antagonist